ncbi:hypothetical protein DL767_006691 [Monosporascus sp. MG133]|nr:hypothetical protein DL767_006691 [Monosporascus sp. MG133]
MRNYSKQGKGKGPEKSRLLTAEEAEQTRAFLRQGCQVWEIALSIQRSEPAVRAALERDQDLAGQLTEKKKGKWSDLEIKYLLELLGRCRVPCRKVMARLLGRDASSVGRQINKMVAERRPTEQQRLPLVPPDGDLSEREQKVLEARMKDIVDGLISMDKTEEWEHVLAEKPSAEWAAHILALIPTPVKHILAASAPPTASTLKAMEWQDTSRMGVYAWVLKPKLNNPLQMGDFVYVGSATKWGSGLSGRKSQHQRRKGRENKIPRLIRTNHLNRKGPFLTLLSMQLESPEPGEVLKARQLIILAEAVLTVWLGALGEVNRDSYGEEQKRLRLRHLCPWDLDEISYRGACSHNPLDVDVHSPTGSAQMGTGDPEIVEGVSSE